MPKHVSCQTLSSKKKSVAVVVVEQQQGQEEWEEVEQWWEMIVVGCRSNAWVEDYCCIGGRERGKGLLR